MIPVYTRKVDMEPNNGGLEDGFPAFNWVIAAQRFHVNFPGSICTPGICFVIQRREFVYHLNPVVRLHKVWAKNKQNIAPKRKKRFLFSSRIQTPPDFS